MFRFQIVQYKQIYTTENKPYLPVFLFHSADMETIKMNTFSCFCFWINATEKWDPLLNRILYWIVFYLEQISEFL